MTVIASHPMLTPCTLVPVGTGNAHARQHHLDTGWVVTQPGRAGSTGDSVGIRVAAGAHATGGCRFDARPDLLDGADRPPTFSLIRSSEVEPLLQWHFDRLNQRPEVRGRGGCVAGLHLVIPDQVRGLAVGEPAIGMEPVGVLVPAFRSHAPRVSCVATDGQPRAMGHMGVVLRTGYRSLRGMTTLPR